MPYLRPFESYGRFRELYMCFKGLYLSLNININPSHFKPLISFLHCIIFIVRKKVRTPPLELPWAFLLLSSISSRNTWIQEAAFGVYCSYRRGLRVDSIIFHFDNFHPESKFQIFEVVPLTFTVWSLYDIQCKSMRLRCLEIV